LINSSRVALPVAATIITVIVMLVVYLSFFAAQGRRYTAEDGDRDRKCSLERDAELGGRIDTLENRVSDIGASLGYQISLLESRIKELGAFHPNHE
jgi:hypothetical protein